jgi:hypothetical protein
MGAGAHAKLPAEVKRVWINELAGLILDDAQLADPDSGTTVRIPFVRQPVPSRQLARSDRK